MSAAVSPVPLFPGRSETRTSLGPGPGGPAALLRGFRADRSEQETERVKTGFVPSGGGGGGGKWVILFPRSRTQSSPLNLPAHIPSA